jgi:uncharacterized protein
MHITLHLTNRCNLACRYCYALKGSDDMTFDTARRAIERCAEGPDCGIIFFGGEPLLRLDLIGEVIEWCRAQGSGRFHYKVTTNGTRLDDAFLDQADRWDLHVAVSHDGVRAAHDRGRVQTDGQGTFDALLPAIGRLLVRRPYSPIMMTVNPATVDWYTESVQWLQSRGAHDLIASLLAAGDWSVASLARLR